MQSLFIFHNIHLRRMVKKKSHSEFIQEFKAINSAITVLGIYKNNKSKIAVKCNRCGWEWSPAATSLLRRHGCPQCAGVKQKNHQEFVEELRSKRDDVIIISPYVKALQKSKFKFLKCGHECEITPAHILSGRGCPVCSFARRGASQRLTMSIFLERLHAIDPNLVILGNGKYINNRTHIPLICKACGKEYNIRPHDILSYHGCPNCHKSNTSYFEKFIYHSFIHILGKSHVISRDKTVIGAELDIYLPGLKAAIEPGSWYWHKNQLEKDRNKHLLCENKGIRLITIYDRYNNTTTIPFDHCLTTPYDLSLPRNTNKLIEMTLKVMSEFGLNPNIDINDWEKIRIKAQIDSRRITTQKFKQELSRINSNVEIIGDFIRSNIKLPVRCKICNYEWTATPSSLRLGSGCPQCAGTLKITHEQFVAKLQVLQPDIIPLTKYINCKTKITVRCNVCNHIWSTQPYHLTAKSGRTGCPKCSRKVRKSHDDFVEEIARLSPSIKIIGTYMNTNNPILVQCRKCNNMWYSYPGNLLKGSGCKKCKVQETTMQKRKKVICIDTGEIFNTLQEAAAKYHISNSSICMCCNNYPKHSHAGGLRWAYMTYQHPTEL